jgi:hypothetical protein
VGDECFVFCLRVAKDVLCTLGPTAPDDVVGSAEPDRVELKALR